MLAVRRFGAGPHPIVALHGFTSTGRQFEALATAIAEPIVAPDLPGHGGSARVRADYPAVVDGVARIVADTGASMLLGYSQGGRVALGVAAKRPDLLRRLVLISANPGIRDDADRASRRDADRTLAASIRAEGLAGFLASWTSTGITDTSHVDRVARARDLAVRSENTAEGLAAALEGMGQGSQPSLWEELSHLDLPVLVITGERDARYTAIGAELAAALPDATHVVIAGAGHNPLLDRPDETAAAVSGFLDRLG